MKSLSILVKSIGIASESEGLTVNVYSGRAASCHFGYVALFPAEVIKIYIIYLLR